MKVKILKDGRETELRDSHAEWLIERGYARAVTEDKPKATRKPAAKKTPAAPATPAATTSADDSAGAADAE